MSKKNCFVPLCKSSERKTPDKIFFVVPKGPRRYEWWKATGRDQVQTLQNDKSLSCRYYCCEDHFDLDNDIANLIQYKVLLDAGLKTCFLKLKKNIIPHKFDCQIFFDIVDAYSQRMITKSSLEYFLISKNEKMIGKETEVIEAPEIEIISTSIKEENNSEFQMKNDIENGLPRINTRKTKRIKPNRKRKNINCRDNIKQEISATNIEEDNTMKIINIDKRFLDQITITSNQLVLDQNRLIYENNLETSDFEDSNISTEQCNDKYVYNVDATQHVHSYSDIQCNDNADVQDSNFPSVQIKQDHDENVDITYNEYFTVPIKLEYNNHADITYNEDSSIPTDQIKLKYDNHTKVTVNEDSMVPTDEIELESNNIANNTYSDHTIITMNQIKLEFDDHTKVLDEQSLFLTDEIEFESNNNAGVSDKHSIIPTDQIKLENEETANSMIIELKSRSIEMETEIKQEIVNHEEKMEGMEEEEREYDQHEVNESQSKIHRKGNYDQILPYTCNVISSYSITEHGDYTCDICKALFKRLKCFNKHKCLKCKICDKVMNHKYRFCRHLLTHGIDVFQFQYNVKLLECNQCHKKFKDKFYLNQHINISHYNIKYKCNYCDKQYNKKESLTYHIKFHHHNNNTTTSNSHNINIDTTNNNNNSNNNHIESSLNIYNNKQIEISSTLTTSPYFCNLCTKYFLSKQSEKRHLLSCHNILTHYNKETNNISYYQCRICNESFNYLNNNDAHWKKSAECKKNMKKFHHQCKKCKKTYLRNYDLKKHMKIHEE